MKPTIKDVIKKLSEKKDLSPQEMELTFGEIMKGSAAKDDIKQFLLYLGEKGETPEEIAAAAKVMRKNAVKVNVALETLIDTCGTGAAAVHDVNVSTISAIVLAGCGLKVAKHGNRSFTGKCGSADLLEALGVDINKGPEEVAELIRKIGIGFIFAPNFHPAMKNVMQARRELKTRTIFNILGPLSNPAGVKMQVLGVYKKELTGIIAEALNRLGSEKAYVVHGLEGLDEISIKGRTRVSELMDGRVLPDREICPADFGMRERGLEDITGADPAHNAKVAMDVLNGKKCVPRDMVLINAAAALKLCGMAADFKDGARLAADCVDSGRAAAKLNSFKEMSRKN